MSSVAAQNLRELADFAWDAVVIGAGPAGRSRPINWRRRDCGRCSSTPSDFPARRSAAAVSIAAASPRSEQPVCEHVLDVATAARRHIALDCRQPAGAIRAAGHAGRRSRTLSMTRWYRKRPEPGAVFLDGVQACVEPELRLPAESSR